MISVKGGDVQGIRRRSTIVPLALIASLALAGGAGAQTESSDAEFAADLFDLGPGLWEQNVSFDGAPAPTSVQMCVDDSIARLASLLASRISGLGEPGCKLGGVTKADGATRFTVACTRQGQRPSTIASTVSKASDEDYVLSTTVTADGTVQARAVNRIHRSGACTTGQQPGDMTAIMSGKPVKLPNMQTLYEGAKE